MIIVPTGDHKYYLWQALVQMNMMQDLDVTWVFYVRNDPTNILNEMIDANIGEIEYYEDWDRDYTYNAAMKPWLTGKYLNDHPTSDEIMLIDPDVLLTGNALPRAYDNIVFGTDTDSYTGPAYLEKKGVLEPLCDLANVDIDIARKSPGIGAQYIFKNIPGHLFEEIAVKSIEAFHLMRELPAMPGETKVQEWCAEMYMTQLILLREGYILHSAKSMDMVWANGPMSMWKNSGYFHDAGVVEDIPGIFRKGAHTISPFFKQHDVSPESASFNYVKAIKEVEQQYPYIAAMF